MARFQDPVTMKCEQCDATTEVRVEHQARPNVAFGTVQFFHYADGWKATTSEGSEGQTVSITGLCPLHGGAGYNPGDKEWRG